MQETPSPELKVCPICKQHVDVTSQSHTLFDCRNFMLRLLYRENDPVRRQELERRVDAINDRLGLKSKNLLDT